MKSKVKVGCFVIRYVWTFSFQFRLLTNKFRPRRKIDVLVVESNSPFSISNIFCCHRAYSFIKSRYACPQTFQFQLVTWNFSISNSWNLELVKSQNKSEKIFGKSHYLKFHEKFNNKAQVTFSFL